jgi:hypothetical protein
MNTRNELTNNLDQQKYNQNNLKFYNQKKEFIFMNLKELAGNMARNQNNLNYCIKFWNLN